MKQDLRSVPTQHLAAPGTDVTKHTPGPWNLDLKNIGLDLPGHVSVDSRLHGALAQVVWVMEDDASQGRSSPRCEANARLIAAAPDLLEALIRLRNAEKAPREEWIAALQDSDAAITKATGVAP